jgi:hypothetical protein
LNENILIQFKNDYIRSGIKSIYLLETVEIPLNKCKLFFAIAGSVLFVVLGVYFLNNSSKMNLNAFLVKGIGIAGIFFFGATGVFVIGKFFDKKAGLIVDNNGITDQSSGVSLGLILWSDITEIEIGRIMSNRFLLIHVRNPEQYLARASGMKK